MGETVCKRELIIEYICRTLWSVWSSQMHFSFMICLAGLLGDLPAFLTLTEAPPFQLDVECPFSRQGAYAWEAAQGIRVPKGA